MTYLTPYQRISQMLVHASQAAEPTPPADTGPHCYCSDAEQISGADSVLEFAFNRKEQA